MTLFISKWHRSPPNDIVHFQMTSFTSKWHRSLPNDIVHFQMTSFTSKWHCSFPNDIVHFQMTSFTSKWHCSLPNDIVHFQMTLFISKWHRSLPNDIVHFQMTLFTSKWHRSLPNDIVHFQMTSFTSKWHCSLPNDIVHFQMTLFISKWHRLDVLLMSECFSITRVTRVTRALEKCRFNSARKSSDCGQGKINESFDWVFANFFPHAHPTFIRFESSPGHKSRSPHPHPQPLLLSAPSFLPSIFPSPHVRFSNSFPRQSTSNCRFVFELEAHKDGVLLNSRLAQTLRCHGWPNGTSNTKYPVDMMPDGRGILERYCISFVDSCDSGSASRRNTMKQFGPGGCYDLLL